MILSEQIRKETGHIPPRFNSRVFGDVLKGLFARDPKRSVIISFDDLSSFEGDVEKRGFVYDDTEDIASSYELYNKICEEIDIRRKRPNAPSDRVIFRKMYDIYGRDNVQRSCLFASMKLIFVRYADICIDSVYRKNIKDFLEAEGFKVNRKTVFNNDCLEVQL